ncbi:MAG: LysR family transcriptional regulator [Lachnospiraceae bacterium]
MNITLVSSFVYLCEYKNISAASKHLNISQQGLSKQLITLESELGVSLFERTNSGVKLTKCGEHLEPVFRSMLENYNEVLNISQKYNKKNNNTIRLGLGHGVTSAIGLDFLTAFQISNPDIEVDVIELYDDECHEALLHDMLDFAFLVKPFSTSNLDVDPVYSDVPCAIINANHPYASTKKALCIKDLHGEPLLILSKKYAMRKRFDELCSQNDVKPHILFSTNSVSSYIDLAKDTCAIALVVRFLTKYLVSENVVVVPLEDGPLYEVCFCRRKDQESTKFFRIFNKFVKNYFHPPVSQ